MNKFVSVKEPALAVEPLIDDTTSKQPLSTTVETTVDINPRQQSVEKRKMMNKVIKTWQFLQIDI